MKKNLALYSLALIVSACSSSPKKVEKVKVDKYTASVTDAPVNHPKVTKYTCPKNDKSFQKENWKQLINIANACVHDKNWKLVDSIANHLAKNEQYSPWGAYYLSLAAQAQGKLEKSIWMIDLAMKKSPKVGMFHYQKARIHWDLKEYGQAVQELKKATDYNDNLFDAHKFLGQIYLRDHNYSLAIRHFEKALSVNSKDYTSLVGAAESYLAAKKVPESVAKFDLTVGHYPKDLELRLRQAYILEFYDKNPTRALESYKKLNNLMSSRIIKGKIEFDIATKIKSLEATVNASQPAKKVSKRDVANEEG